MMTRITSPQPDERDLERARRELVRELAERKGLTEGEVEQDLRKNELRHNALQQEGREIERQHNDLKQLCSALNQLTDTKNQRAMDLHQRQVEIAQLIEEDEKRAVELTEVVNEYTQCNSELAERAKKLRLDWETFDKEVVTHEYPYAGAVIERVFKETQGKAAVQGVSTVAAKEKKRPGQKGRQGSCKKGKARRRRQYIVLGRHVLALRRTLQAFARNRRG